ncbi:polyhydroxyalkanoate synthesis repressor PhaR [Azomonas agilis]|uniref:Polyhydroxyalkanoate synthesis repressor PhaR n=1 Tax=Azomonas agilis TaxID=116849 RepID=A0A562IXS9_9GAMM|nr:polyhydroxyalkanoate synthesis repressor PhaR [Azomonas agilis]TWH75777.1 polyhydroxyalkanoate synthesis repressor PhaR [Azomonas agilis]
MSEMPSSIRLIKKYPNRRLYDTQLSAHITLADVRQLVVDDVTFQILDAKTGEDLTRSVLLQVIQEAESGTGEPIFSSDMLKNIIRCYGPWQGVWSRYLEHSIQTLLDIQSKSGLHSTQAWADFLRTQTPLMGDLLSRYMEQSKQLYLNTHRLFGLFPTFNNDNKSSDK